MHLEVEEETPVPVATETPVLKVAPCGGRSTRGELPKKQRPMPRKHERDLLDERVKIAEDMLASVNGIELYTSVSGGHFMAFCKAANAGCKTKVKSIMDEKGYLDAGKLKRDFVFKKLLENGWNCIVINAHAEEIEVCVSMNEFASNMQKIGTEVNWDTCMKAAKVLQKYGSLYSGDEGAPEFLRLDKFAKKDAQ